MFAICIVALAAARIAIYATSMSLPQQRIAIAFYRFYSLMLDCTFFESASSLHLHSNENTWMPAINFSLEFVLRAATVAVDVDAKPQIVTSSISFTRRLFHFIAKLMMRKSIETRFIFHSESNMYIVCCKLTVSHIQKWRRRVASRTTMNRAHNPVSEPMNHLQCM